MYGTDAASLNLKINVQNTNNELSYLSINFYRFPEAKLFIYFGVSSFIYFVFILLIFVLETQFISGCRTN